MKHTNSTPLRALTQLAPSLPLELFQVLCDAIAAATKRDVELTVAEEATEAEPVERDPFGPEGFDIGFIRSPTYLNIRSKAESSIELVPAGIVFDDDRVGEDPVYFSDVVVRSQHVADCFDDLEGAVWGYNDPNSLSGHLSVRQRLQEFGQSSFFAREVDTGSHLRSLQAILQRDIDAAAIDSNVLRSFLAEYPVLRSDLRIVDSFGPFPIQPIVLRRELAPELMETITTALLSVGEHRVYGPALKALGVTGLIRTTGDTYEEERSDLRALGLIA